MDYRKAFFLDGKGDIGAKIVDTLSQAGASVLVTDIDATVGESLVKNI
jgi:Trk K+ transport system NAD-binding subunit